MYVVEVIPLSRATKVTSLTYYTAVPYSLGTIVTIPVRNQELRGLVTSIATVGAAKTALRSATFTLRRLPEQTVVESLPPTLIATARELGKSLPATQGAILFGLIPEEVRAGTERLESHLPCIGTYELPMVSVLQGTYVERYQIYRSKVRESFAHRGSVMFVVPTSADVDRAREVLAHGIEQRIVTFAPSYTPKHLARSYDSFHDLSHAKLIITTPAHAMLDRHDITHIIIDNARSAYYKSRTRPYLDTRDALMVLAKMSGRSVLLGDVLPHTEHEYLRREDIYQTEGEHPIRIAFKSTVTVLDTSAERKPETLFRLISDDLEKRMRKTLSQKQSVFLFAARRGIAPAVTCADCGHLFTCPDSGAPYSLLRTKNGESEQRWFISTTSGKRIRASDTCPTCGSWRLKERGVGIQQVYDEVAARFPDVPIIVFDHTTATTARKAQSLISQFYDQRRCILIGTTMVLPYLERPVSLSAITSFDAARSMSTWRADEEFLALALTIRERTEHDMVVQTRSPHDPLLAYLKDGLVDQFYTEEIVLRKTLNYPPFYRLIHLTIKGETNEVHTLETRVSEVLRAYTPRWYSAPQQVESAIRYGLIRVPAHAWPDPELTALLTSLHPSIRVELDPARIV